jgi:hypothetical protein
VAENAETLTVATAMAMAGFGNNFMVRDSISE